MLASWQKKLCSSPLSTWLCGERHFVSRKWSPTSSFVHRYKHNFHCSFQHLTTCPLNKAPKNRGVLSLIKFGVADVQINDPKSTCNMYILTTFNQLVCTWSYNYNTTNCLKKNTSSSKVHSSHVQVWIFPWPMIFTFFHFSALRTEQ